MSTLIKYLSLEAIDNTVTCLNYKIDKIVFFGRNIAILEEKTNISSFLFKYCDCESEFIDVYDKSAKELESILESIINKGECYFDFTGDEGMFEALAYKLSNKYDIPSHTYDVWNKQAIIFKENKDGGSIANLKREKPIKLTIKSYIEMIGGKTIDSSLNKYDINPYLLSFRKTLGPLWTTFSSLLSRTKIANENKFKCSDLDSLIDNNHFKISKDKVLSLIDELYENKIIDSLVCNTNGFEFKSDLACILAQGGAILEQIVYNKEKENSDDCAVGLSFSWDLESDYYDVRNEIDVVCLKDYQLTFISCKDKEVERNHLYELVSVARGFAGNYAKMKLVTTVKPSNNLIQRGKELGVEIEHIKTN